MPRTFPVLCPRFVSSSRQSEMRSTVCHRAFLKKWLLACFVIWAGHAELLRTLAMGGIDVVLDGPDGATAGVQVKRYKKTRKIEAEQIRSLAGALIFNGHTRGAFVTTSSFRRGAKSAARRFGTIGTPIELLDCERFFEALGIAQRKTWRLDLKAIRKRIMVEGVHIGSGKYAPYKEGEDLLDREIVICVYLANEFIDQRPSVSQRSYGTGGGAG